MSTYEKIYEIVSSHLNSENKIPLLEMDSLLTNSGFTNEVHGCESLLQLLEYMGNDFFSIEKDIENSTIITLNKIITTENPVQELTRPSLERTEEQVGEKSIEVEKPSNDSCLSMVINIIERMCKESHNQTVGLAQLGLRLARQEIKIRKNDSKTCKLIDFIKSYPAYFCIEYDNNNLPYVRLTDNKSILFEGSSKIPALERTVQKKTNNALLPTVEQSSNSRYVSQYKINDFVYFPDYKYVYKLLSQIADLGDCFILSDEREINPYYMIELTLKLNFAKNVKDQIDNNVTHIIIGLDFAEFDTGFKTPDNKPIYAKLRLNQERNTKHYQNFIFDDFIIKE